MAVKAERQLRMDEQVITDEDLESLLEKRETQKAKKSKEAGAFRELDDQAKARIKQLELSNGVGRIGRFRLTLHPRAGRSIAFETSPGMRIAIMPDKE